MNISVVNVSAFIGSATRPAKADKNGKMPVFLRTVAGQQLPADALVISGTVAERAGLRIGNTATISVTKTGERDFEGKMRANYSYSILDQSAGAQITNKLLEGFSFTSTVVAPVAPVVASEEGAK